MPNGVYSYANKTAAPLTETPYAKEDILQDLIAKNPHLLLRDNLSDNALMLVGQEFAVQITEDAGGTYSLDHLFIDKFGVPVLVEVKRSTDTRIKREVVAQMLDYAARARCWSIDQVRSAFLSANEDPIADEYKENDEFWQKVETNLKAEHLRLIFVADQIPDTLRTLIEFMDRAMPGMEVYGIEVKQFVNDGNTMLSVRVVESVQSKDRSSMTYAEWDAASCASYLLSHDEAEAESAIASLLPRLTNAAIPYRFGRGAKHPSIIISSGKYTICTIAPSGTSDTASMVLAFDLDWCAKHFSEQWSLNDIQLRLEQGFDVPGRRTPQYLYFDAKCLNNPSNMGGYINTLQWLKSMVV